MRLPRIDTEDHEASSMQSHLRLAMTTNKREKNELTRKHDELKRDFDNLLSVVSTELSSIHISPNDETPISGIRTILTSLTTMIRADGTVYIIYEQQTGNIQGARIRGIL